MTQEEKQALRQELCDALLTCDETKAADCIRSGADINAPDADGYTPIYDAIDAGNVDAVKLIAKLGGDLNHEYMSSDDNLYNEAPALLAIKVGDPNTFMCLLELGVSPNNANSAGVTLLMKACAAMPLPSSAAGSRPPGSSRRWRERAWIVTHAHTGPRRRPAALPWCVCVGGYPRVKEPVASASPPPKGASYSRVRLR